MSFRKNLEYLRKSKKLSQEELASKLNVSRQSVSKWESGAAYPETEKMLVMCKIFDCSLDQLMNDDMAEIEKSEARKYTFNDLLNEVTKIIRGTIEMLSSMNVKSIIKFLFELGLLFVVVLLLNIPFSYINRIGSSFFYSFGATAGGILSGFWEFLTQIVYFVVAVLTFSYIYKIRFIDKFHSVQEAVENEKEPIVEEHVIGEKEVVKNIEVKKYDFGLFSLIGKFAIAFVKCFAFFISLPVVFLLFCASAGVLIGIVWMFSGIYYLGVIVFLLSFIVFAVSLLKAFYNFIVDHRTDWKKLFVAFIISIIGLGIGAGISFLDFSKFTISQEAPSRVVSDKKIVEYPMSENLILFPYGNVLEDSYVVDNSLVDTVKVEVEYYGMVTEPVISILEVDGKREIHVSSRADRSINLRDMYKVFLDDLKNNTISNYAALGDFNVKVYSSEENIEKFKSNFYERYREVETQYGIVEEYPEPLSY
ncbi:MAG TPA: helix-turn-helix transcriptional regulator [Candidatus Dojkabacteria bacterium]|nr:helix-turn-helix transcriptional regulator [Candidatus Dojkabacteria bacterium]